MDRLRPLADDLFCAEDEHAAPGGVCFPLRMTVLRLPDGGVVLWSPIRFDDGLAAEIEALGPVRWVVAPNLLHHLHAEGALARFPAARLLGAPGLAQKRADLRLDGTLGPASNPWPEVVELFRVEGAPRMEEVVLLHRPSRTLVVVDLVFNIQKARNWRSWFVFKVVSGVYRRVAQSRVWRFFAKDRRAAGRSVQSILRADFDRLVMAHGEVVETGGKEALERAAAWMLRGA